MSFFEIQFASGPQKRRALTGSGHLEYMGFFALVYGSAKPEPAIEHALEETSGSWRNRVKWCKMRRAYLVTGIEDVDPNYGDDASRLDHRLRRIVGDSNVAIWVRRPNGIVFSEGTFVQALVNEQLAATGRLN